MYDNDSKGISYAAGFFLLIAFTIAGFFTYQLISGPIWVGMTGRPIEEMNQGLSNPAFSNAGKVLQSLSAIVGFFIPAVVTASLLSRKPFKLLGFTGRVNGGQMGLILLIVVASFFAGTALTYFNYHIPIPAEWKTNFDKLENEYNRQSEAILGGLKNSGDYILAMIVMGFLPALCEETLFRGGLQNFLYRSTRNSWVSIIVVSIIFSAVHFSFYGFLYRFLLGFILGWVYHYSGRMWLNIIVHFLNNAYVITAFYIFSRQGRSLAEVANDTPSSFWGLIALPALIALLMVFKRMSFAQPKY